MPDLLQAAQISADAPLPPLCGFRTICSRAFPPAPRPRPSGGRNFVYSDCPPEGNMNFSSSLTRFPSAGEGRISRRARLRVGTGSPSLFHRQPRAQCVSSGPSRYSGVAADEVNASPRWPESNRWLVTCGRNAIERIVVAHLVGAVETTDGPVGFLGGKGTCHDKSASVVMARVAVWMKVDGSRCKVFPCFANFNRFKLR